MVCSTPYATGATWMETAYWAGGVLRSDCEVFLEVIPTYGPQQSLRERFG
mgnify:CR=1 FL=1